MLDLVDTVGDNCVRRQINLPISLNPIANSVLNPAMLKGQVPPPPPLKHS